MQNGASHVKNEPFNLFHLYFKHVLGKVTLKYTDINTGNTCQHANNWNN